MLGVLLNQLLIFIIGGLGNILTLVAIPYVKHKYGSEFSLLQLSSVVLMLHLSVSDLLYAVLGLPNFIRVYLLRDGVIEEGSCYYPSLLRHLVAYVDFNTIGMIACCVARHNLCTDYG